MTPGFAVWLTGLPCSGKTTLAEALKKELRDRGLFPRILDGDALRKTLSADLGYSPEDRKTHIRRVTTMARALVDSGIPAIIAVISPHQALREEARMRIKPLAEVYVRCPLSTCESRDVKGLYRRARNGEIQDFTGISSPYEPPKWPDVVVDTDSMSVPACLDRILVFLEESRFVAEAAWLVDRKKRTG